MSQEALEIQRRHRSRQVEYGTNSEEFSIVSGGTFRGVFDEAHLEDKRDTGNVLQKKLPPLIMVATVPTSVIVHSSVIRREEWQAGDKEYKVQYIGKDAEGIPILWLF